MLLDPCSPGVPKKLCCWIAYKRPFSAAALAKQSHGRIGEAKNPEPRGRGSYNYRANVNLAKVSLVQLATNKLGYKVYGLFLSWVSDHFSPGAADSSVACPATLSELAKEFGFVLFEERHSLYMVRQLLTFLLRERPNIRPFLGGALQLVSKWQRLEPIEHRAPVSLVLLRAMTAVALAWEWDRFAAVVLVTFFGITRPGEVLKTRRRELLLPSDLVAEGSNAKYLKILGPKSQHRGLGLVQHTKIDEPTVTAFCQRLFSLLPETGKPGRLSTLLGPRSQRSSCPGFPEIDSSPVESRRRSVGLQAGCGTAKAAVEDAAFEPHYATTLCAGARSRLHLCTAARGIKEGSECCLVSV